MGKMIFYITAIIIIDIALLATGQMCIIESGTQQCGISSIIFKAIVNLLNLNVSLFFTQIVGDFSNLIGSKTGFMALLAGGAVAVTTYLASSSEQRIFIPIALTLGIIVGDFIFLFSSLGIPPLIGTLIIAPLAITFILTVLDWIRGKD